MGNIDIRWRQRFQNFENAVIEVNKDIFPALKRLYNFFVQELQNND